MGRAFPLRDRAIHHLRGRNQMRVRVFITVCMFVGLALAFAGCGDEDTNNTITEIQELLKLTASDAADGDNFGSSVSISGDYAIVGAWKEDGVGTDRGAAYVFYRNQGGADNWGEVTKLTASDAATFDHFGLSLDISGDNVLVSAYQKNGAGIDRGAAYVFNRNQGGADNWGEVKKLTASDTEDGDYFGHSLSISGDYAIVGAHYEDGTGTDRGAAYVFYRNQGGIDNWGEVTKLTASDAADSDHFGVALFLSGDNAIVGAYQEDGAGFDRGAAYVFNRNQGGADNWGEVKKLTASDTEDGDYFGHSIFISGDYAIVGAYPEDGAGTDRGAAYVFNRNHGGTDNWGEVTKLTASDAADSDYFGVGVSMSGDYVMVGANYEDGDSPSPDADRGAVYVFNRNHGGTDNWGEVKKLTASDNEDGDRFGLRVSVSGAYIIVGAWQEDGSGTPPDADRGAAYIYEQN